MGSILIKRETAWLIDLIIATGIVFIPDVLLTRLTNYNPFFFTVAVGFLLFICKDMSGRSVGKRILGLQIVNSNKEGRVSLWKLTLRNILSPFWIVDAIICLCTQGEKIEDLILNITVIENTNNILNN